MKKEIRELNAPVIGLIADILDKHMDAILGEVIIRFKQIKADQSSEPAEPVTIPQTVASDNPEPVAWLVYVPSEEAQRVYDSQEDPGFIDDITNAPDAVITPLYAAPQPQQTPDKDIPEGYKLVPIEPTPEMLKSGWAENDVSLTLRWKAMLEAAPEVKG